MVCNESDGNTYYYIQNYRGDVVMLVGANGNVISIRDYDAGGQIMLKAPDIDKDRAERDQIGFLGLRYFISKSQCLMFLGLY